MTCADYKRPGTTGCDGRKSNNGGRLAILLLCTIFSARRFALDAPDGGAHRLAEIKFNSMILMEYFCVVTKRPERKK
jgi:hypothetical protein